MSGTTIDVAHLVRQREWSRATFGPGDRRKGILDHIRKELVEIEEAGERTDEWFDVVILALDGAWRDGYEPAEIIAAIKAKQAKNERRTWPDWRTADPDRAIEHVRTPAAGRGDTDDSGEAGTCRWSQRRCSDPSTMCIVDCAIRPAEPPGELRFVQERIGRAELDRLRGLLSRYDRDSLTPWEVVEIAADEFAPLLAAQATVKRVEALAKEWKNFGTRYTLTAGLAAEELDRALDGPQ